MAEFCLNDSDEYYLALSEQPKRFDADSPVTNVFFDDTNGQVLTVRSGGVTGVTVTGMDESKSTSFRMEDRGPIISIKFSPDHNILAIQRNHDNQTACVEFVNFKDLAPTNVEYSHPCKWKNAKILGFVWPRVNEIAYITDHGIELLQVLPEKKQLKSLKSTSFSGAWFSWCAQSSIVLLAGNNGALLQPFALNNSTIHKLQKLELESARPVAERDVVLLRLCGAAWCAVFRHGGSGALAPAPTEVSEACARRHSTRSCQLWLMPVGGGEAARARVLRTGLAGRFAVNALGNLVVVHHQSSQTSLLFDMLEGAADALAPVAPPRAVRPARLAGEPCPMYSSNWVVFQPDYIVDARLGCLWRLSLVPSGLAHAIPKDEIPKVVAALLRRADGEETIYRILDQLVSDPAAYLVQITKVFDEINCVYRKWADSEVARQTAGAAGGAARPPVLVTQDHVCAALAPHNNLVQVVTAYLASLARHGLAAQPAAAALAVRALAAGGARARLRALARRGALADRRALACQLLALGAPQPALDMMWRLQAVQEIVEVLLGGEEPVAAAGAARAAGARAWAALPARKLLHAARGHPPAFAALYRALRARNERLRGAPDFLPGEQCDTYVEYYNYIMS